MLTLWAATVPYVRFRSASVETIDMTVTVALPPESDLALTLTGMNRRVLSQHLSKVPR